MSKIDLSNYDFKDVLEWVCEQFPDEKYLIQNAAQEAYIIFHGYRFNLEIVKNAITQYRDGLRSLVKNMDKIEESKRIMKTVEEIINELKNLKKDYELRHLKSEFYTVDGLCCAVRAQLYEELLSFILDS